MIEAKAVSNKFWILKNDDKKVGEVNANRSGYVINIDGVKQKFTSLETLKVKTGIKFTNITKNEINDDTVYGFPYRGEKFNEVWDLKSQLPLYTKKDDSKSWFAAGYFKVKIKGKWRDMLSPKQLILERNEYNGPFKTISNELLPDTAPETTTKNIMKLSFTKDSALSKWFDE